MLTSNDPEFHALDVDHREISLTLGLRRSRKPPPTPFTSVNINNKTPMETSTLLQQKRVKRRDEQPLRLFSLVSACPL